MAREIMAERFVKEMLKASARKPRLTKAKRVTFPTVECPLPDFDKGLTDTEWLMSCHLVHHPGMMRMSNKEE